MSNLSWNQLFLNGSIVSLTVSKWRAQVKLKAQDLGLENSKDVQRALTLGRCRLAPSIAFAAINGAHRRATDLIDSFSVNFSGIPGARYVPEKNLEPLLAQLQDIQTEFNSAVDLFMANYETTKYQMLPIIEKAIADAAKDPEIAAEAYKRLVGEYPSSPAVRAQFRLDWSVYALSSPKSKTTADAISAESEKVKGVVAEMVKQAREEVTEKLGQILQIVNKGGSLKSTSVDSALALLNRIESLNIMGDEVLGRQINALRNFLNGVDKGQVGEDFVPGLTSIKDSLEKSVDDAIIEAEKKLTGMGRRELEL